MHLCTKRFNGRDDLHGILRGDSADLKGDVLSVLGWRNSGKGLLWAVSVIQCVLKGCPEGDKNDDPHVWRKGGVTDGLWSFPDDRQIWVPW